MPWSRWLAILGFCSMAALAAETGPNAPRPFFTDEFDAPIKAGYLQLNWELPAGETLRENQRFELVSSQDPSFAPSTQRYRGPDQGSFITGLPDGPYYFRVRVLDESGTDGPWSEPISVRVEHHSLKRSFALFGIGAVVFLATVVVILVGNARAEIGTGRET